MREETLKNNAKVIAPFSAGIKHHVMSWTRDWVEKTNYSKKNIETDASCALRKTSPKHLKNFHNFHITYIFKSSWYDLLAFFEQTMGCCLSLESFLADICVHSFEWPPTPGQPHRVLTRSTWRLVQPQWLVQPPLDSLWPSFRVSVPVPRNYICIYVYIYMYVYTIICYKYFPGFLNLLK